MRGSQLGACILVLALAPIGCASPVTVALTSDARTGLSGGEGRRLTVVAPFEDGRPDRGRCGAQTGNFGEGPSILCDKEPARFIADALISALRNAGFAVGKAEARNVPRETPVVRGVVEQLFVEPTGGFSHFVIEADLHVRLELRSPTGIVATRSFFVKGNQGAGGTIGGAVQDAVSDAVQRIVKQMVAALLSLENQYPELEAAALEGSEGGRTP